MKTKIKKAIKNIILPCLLIGILVLPYFVFASSPLSRLNAVANQGGFDTNNADQKVSEIIGAAIKAFLGLLGVVFIIMIVYAGYSWMIAGGNEEKVTRAIAIIRRAIIGLVIVIGSYAIWAYVFTNLIS